MEKFTYDGMRIWVRDGQHNADDKYTVGEVRSYMLPPFEPRTILDIGAHIGAFSCWMNYLYPEVEITAVEPDRDNFAVLKKNLTSARHLSLFGYMGSDDGLSVTLKRHPEHATMTKVVYDGSGDTFAPECIFLEWIMDERGWDSIDLLKIDCEGCEDEVLKSSDLSVVKFITGERHVSPQEFADTLGRHLEESGFRYTTTSDPLAHATFCAWRDE